MTHKIIYNPETGFVEAKVEGTVNRNEFKEIQSEVLGMLIEKGVFLYLADYREATVNLSTVEIYERPALLSKATTALGGNIHKFKRAVVVAKNLKDTRLEDYKFFETVTLNRGQKAKLFDDVEEAKKWLSN